MKQVETMIALNRLGLGARPGDAEAGAREALIRQCADPASFLIAQQSLPTGQQAGQVLATYLQQRRTRRDQAKGATAIEPSPEAQMQAVVRPVREMAQFAFADVVARTGHAVATPNGFAERLVLFWSNHFTVAKTKVQTIPFAGVFEREAIRANMTGSFADLLIAAVRHPGMMLYLDQVQSVGPNSRVGQRRQGGLNENLAREILELHTVGVNGGYAQADVTEFARALTGSTIGSERIQRFVPDATLGGFTFVGAMHEPGARTVMGRTYAEGEAGQSVAIMRDLARHPGTARHVATKLAAHFVADTPPPALVAALETTFRKTDGDLPSLHRALVEHPTTWQPDARKFKSPNEFLISSLRAVGGPVPEPRVLAQTYRALGQVPFRAPSPAGWPDDAASWAGSDAIMKRLEWTHTYMAGRSITTRPDAIAQAALGPMLSARTRTAITRAETPVEGVVLALMSPEFQRR